MDLERRVRRPPEATSASAHLGGVAGPASWVSGMTIHSISHYLVLDLFNLLFLLVSFYLCCTGTGVGAQKENI